MRPASAKSLGAKVHSRLFAVQRGWVLELTAGCLSRSWCSAGRGAPVDGARVPGLRNQLGRQVLRRAAQRLALAARRDLLGEPKVRHLHVALGVDQQVLGLQVPAHQTGCLRNLGLGISKFSGFRSLHTRQVTSGIWD